MLLLAVCNFKPSSEQMSCRNIRLFKRRYHAADPVTLCATASSPNFHSEYVSNRSFGVFKTFEICSIFLTFDNNLGIIFS